MATRTDVRRISLTMAALVIATPATWSCSRESDRPDVRADSATTRVSAAAAATTRDSSAAAASAPSTSSPVFTVSEHGIGALRVGMTFDQASQALGGALRVPVGIDTTGCDYLVWSDGPSGVHVMFDQHRIARIDVDTVSIATTAGARIGDDEARIERLYPGRVKVTPHKYEDGHYLTVTPTAAADKQFRIVFETARGRVTRYRAGLKPSVDYVEGCS
jgi:hypothetical protein